MSDLIFECIGPDQPPAKGSPMKVAARLYDFATMTRITSTTHGSVYDACKYYELLPKRATVNVRLRKDKAFISKLGRKLLVLEVVNG